MMEFNLATSVITLNVKSLSISVKRQRLSYLIKKKARSSYIHATCKKPTLGINIQTN